MNDIKYGDSLVIKIVPKLEQEIAQSLEDWIVELSKKENIDLLQEQFCQTKKLIRILVENSDHHAEVSNHA